MRKKVLLIVLIMGGVLIMMSTPPCHAQTKTQYRVGILPIMGHLPILLASQNAAYELEKIEVNLDIYNSWTALEAAYRVGAVDAAAITLPKALIMAYENIPLRIVLVINRNGTALVLNDDDPEALKGKILGGSGNDTTQLLILKEVLNKKGLKLGYDVRSILTRFHRAIARVKEGRFFGFCLPAPYGVLAKKAGIGEKILLSKDIAPDHIASVLIIHPDFMVAHPGSTKELIRSIIEAAKFIEKDKTATGGRQTAMMQADFFNLDTDVVQEALTNPPDRVSFRGLEPSGPEIETIMVELMKAGIMPGRVDLDKFITTEYNR